MSEYWSCPGCGALVLDSEVPDHPSWCDWVDGAGRPLPRSLFLAVFEDETFGFEATGLEHAVLLARSGLVSDGSALRSLLRVESADGSLAAFPPRPGASGV